VLRILIAEDSAVQRELLIAVLDEAGGFDIVATAASGREAVAATERLKPDIVLMDCHMPELNGIEATRLIMERQPTPIVIVSATLQRDDVLTTFDAMKCGALSVLVKPTGPGDPEHHRLAEQMVRTLRLMAEVKVVRRWGAGRAQRAAAPPRPPRVLRAVALAGSTGAPGIIADILAGLGPTLAVPVLIVQHLTPGYAPGYALWLNGKGGPKVELARDGMPALAGTAYVAPDDAHLGIDARGRIALSHDAPDGGFRPSANHLFRSLARAFGPMALGVILTGMGRDGAAGLLAMRQAGALTVAQSEESCVVFGMPGEAVRLNAVTNVLPPQDIIRLIASCAADRARV
jgi:two-component system chemotaxis response regulator CheB